MTPYAPFSSGYGSPWPKGGGGGGYGGYGGYDQGYGAKGGYPGGYAGYGKGGFAKGGMPKGKGKGKGKSKDGDSKGYKGYDANDPRRAIEMAQRRAQNRDLSGIALAQQQARERFEKDLIDRISGKWVDSADHKISYTVEGNLCSVAGDGAGDRVFRNRISVQGGDLVLDARRWWHKLNMTALPPAGEEVTRVEWAPGKDSPPTKALVWVRPSPEDDDDEDAPVCVPTPPAPPTAGSPDKTEAAKESADKGAADDAAAP
jgi:hypothetical protein